MQTPLYPLYRFLFEGFSLQGMGIFLGLILVLTHAAALRFQIPLRKLLPRFPRHTHIGMALMIFCTLWVLILLAHMDLGEFYVMRKAGLAALPVVCYLVIKFVPEFLAVRATGILLLLLAAPVLEAAFLKPPITRLLLPTLAYVWILVGLFWIGMPFLMRDWIQRLVDGGETLWRKACYLGMGYGAAILLCAVIFWRGY